MATKATVKVKLTGGAVRLLYWMLKAPSQFVPAAQAQNVQPYKAPDLPAEKEVLSLHRMVDSVVSPVENTTMVTFKPYDGTLRKNLVDRAKEIMKHYEQYLRLCTNLPDYMELRDGLEGKEPGTDIEPWQE